ncbi:MAG: PHP domain-containing protein [Nitrospirae bacterium]|nr:PHP domain-containing protein [Nitrospirota bacterium]
MKSFKGIIHVHSNYSYDGKHSLEEITHFARKRGYSFIGMSEHSDTFNEDIMSEYVKECQRVSTPDCLIIPGIEFTCENDIHIIGLGVQQYTNIKDPLKVAEFVRQQGGISIIAHPSRYNYQIPLDLACAVDGIEVWNAAYDGRFVPNDKSLNLIKEIRKGNGSILVFGGQELHRISDCWNIETTAFCNKLCKDAIIYSFKQGDFTISNPYFKLDSLNESGWLKMIQIRTARKMYYIAKLIRDYMCANKGIINTARKV